MKKSYDVRLLRMPDVERCTGYKKSKIYTLIKEGEFPVPVQLGKRAIAFRSDEIHEWVEARPRCSK